MAMLKGLKGLSRKIHQQVANKLRKLARSDLILGFLPLNFISDHRIYEKTWNQ